MRRYRILNSPDDENIYGNINNNSGLNEDSSLNELKDLAVEINDSELKIDINESQVPMEDDDLYQIDTTSNSDSGIEYHEQLPYENVQEYTPNNITADGYNEIPSEEAEEPTYQVENVYQNNELTPQEEVSFEYNDDEINNEVISENKSVYTPITEAPVETPEEQETIDAEEFQEEEFEANQEDTYDAPNYGEETYQEDQQVQDLKPKKNFIPMLMAIFAVIIFFVVLNLPQVKEKISGNKTEDISKEQIEELNELSNPNNSQVQIDEKNQDKRAKMVVFDEEQKETGSSNVKICANPFLPTMSIGEDNGNDNSLGAYEIIGPPNGSEIDNSVEVSAMMETKVSGILYDRDNPQAILNYDGQDQLVRRGDRLAGFYVMSITPDKVILKQGNNIYRVSVGQTVTDEGINYNVNSNLGKQFGGRYKNIKGKIININE